MRSYLYLLVVLISLPISLNTVRIFSFEEISLFLTVVGLIYGLIAAFTISNAWERFSKIRDGITEEISSLTTLYFFSKKLSDKERFNKIKNILIEYCEEVPTILWHKYWESKETHKKFMSLIETVSDIQIKSKKDELLFESISEELREATSARDLQLILSQSRISKIQWVLIIFLSAILITGLIFLSIPNYILSIFITASMVAAVLMILIVLYEINSMKVFEEEVSIEPYREIVRIIKSNQ